MKDTLLNLAALLLVPQASLRGAECARVDSSTAFPARQSRRYGCSLLVREHRPRKPCSFYEGQCSAR